MSRTLLALGLTAAAGLASGCITSADLALFGMDSRPRPTVVEPTRAPFILETAPAPAPDGEAAEPGIVEVPLEPPAHLYRGPARRGWNAPWARPLAFGLPADEGDARWSVLGAGRGPLGMPLDAPPPRLTFGDDAPTPAPAPAPPGK